VDDKVYQAVCLEAARRNISVSGLAQQALLSMVAVKTTTLGVKKSEKEQRLRLVDLLEQCQIDLTEQPKRKATYARRCIQ
jgi:predicted HicB family RNase H-like nuclease